MNELQLIVQSLVAQGNYKGAVIAAQYQEEVMLEGAGHLQTGKLAVMIMASYLSEVPKDKRNMMKEYICQKAEELIDAQATK